MRPYQLIYLFFCLFFLSCSRPEAALFTHDFDGNAVPWTKEQFDNAGDKFSFALISDLYGGERPGVFEVAVEQLNLLRPEFVLSIGDLIDGGHKDVKRLHAEWDSFDNRATKLHAPLFRVGGNHDLTNGVMREVWKKRYGKRYYAFTYKNVLFLVLDTEGYTPERLEEIYTARAEAREVMDGPNPEKAVETAYFKMEERRTGEIGEDQVAYFITVLENRFDVRWTFVIMHKPVYLAPSGEGFSALLNALSDRPYTLINGHRHTYSYELRSGRDYLMLGTTGGSQNASDPDSYDHITWVTVASGPPSIANIALEGIRNKLGHVPAGGDSIRFSAYGH